MTTEKKTIQKKQIFLYFFIPSIQTQLKRNQHKEEKKKLKGGIFPFNSKLSC